MKYISLLLPNLLLLTVTFLLTTNLVYSQSEQSEVTSEDLRDLVSGKVVPEIRKTEIIGSPYLFDKFREGSLELYNGSKTEVFLMNFNIHDEWVEYLDGNSIIAIGLDRVKSFEFYNQNKVQVFRKGYSSKKLDPSEFVEVLAAGKATLLLKQEVNLHENIASYGSATKKNEYRDNQRYYIHKGNKTIYLKRLRERTILRELGNSNELKRYIKEKNLDMRSIADITQLVNYYNKIQES